MLTLALSIALLTLKETHDHRPFTFLTGLTKPLAVKNV